MASMDDAYNQLVAANNKLDELINGVHGVRELVAFEVEQNTTMICALEKVSKQTCELVNQSVRQTTADELVAIAATAIQQLYELSNPEAAVEQGRLQRLKEQVEKCCPPAQPEPPCKYEPCKPPGKAPRDRTKG